ncbi:uncharacterized protein LOC115634800 [Scaptodrosophila lebanonensis]|uniref:Uncharacterized protein LOC115634800 n=1 Tax=Drosophila lebanonensis TaxID=7225 RepID=A0A6J2UMC7_DROLE|nr:uncharacterized protein LOC115634800 [Scaptodrosophila lebanonensis]
MFKSNRLLILICCTLCTNVRATTVRPAARRAQIQDDVQLLHPHIITIERLENLLRRAGEIFASGPENGAVALVSQQEQTQPKEHMLPPTDQPYNFYLPLFDYVDPKLDAKSRHMEKIVPPPHPSQQEQNFYAAKPKKTPKKFNAAAKHVNLKWLNTYEKAMGGAAPKAIYLEQDERNRINFDDSFFAVDMQVKIPDNQPHREQLSSGLLQHGEEFPDEDLMAAPAQISYNYKAAQRA